MSAPASAHSNLINRLSDLQNTVTELRGMAKAASFIPAPPMPGQQGAPMDPAMMGQQGAPMDPSMMAPQGGAPMDPSMMGGMPMDPSMMAQQGAPMDPSMMAQQGAPMDPAAMGQPPGGAPLTAEMVDELFSILEEMAATSKQDRQKIQEMEGQLQQMEATTQDLRHMLESAMSAPDPAEAGQPAPGGW